MQITVKNPELEQFVDEQVGAGHFPSADAVVEAAIERFRDGAELDDETIDPINESSHQAEQGEGLSLEEFREQFGKRI